MIHELDLQTNMARNEQLIRQHRILHILERYRFGRTLQEIRDDVIDELGLTSLHTRSVRRDLDALQAAGIDLASHESPRGRIWKLGPRFRGSHKITASATELIALSLGRDLLYPLAGTPFWLGIESFWTKMRDSLPSAVWEHYKKYRRVLHVLGTPAKTYKKQQGILKTVNRAILEHRVVSVDYQSLGHVEATERLIHPYGVVFYQSSLYIVADLANDKQPEDIRHLKLDRFVKATALDQWFKPRKGFDTEQHLRQSVGIFSGSKAKQFRIKMSALAARWVEEDPWHPDQHIKKHADGSITLTVQASHELEIIPRVLALGIEAELLSPTSSRKTIAAIVQKLGKTYK